MRWLGLWLLLVAAPAVAQAPDAARRETAMAEAVLRQLEAFRKGDWAAAYSFASAGIRSRFTPEAFREMVTRGYAPIARPLQSWVLQTRLIDAQRGLVEIRVEGQDGQTIDALYELVEEQGVWKINGVVAKPVEPGPSAGALLPWPRGAPEAMAGRAGIHRGFHGITRMRHRHAPRGGRRPVEKEA